MNNNELDLEQIDQLAREFWQDDLAKFFPKQKEPTYTEYRMFSDGYKQGYFDCLYKSEYIILKHEGKYYKCFELEPFFDTEKQNG